jgi:hypothetical protein
MDGSLIDCVMTKRVFLHSFSSVAAHSIATEESRPYLFLSLQGLRRSPWQSRICFFFVVLNKVKNLVFIFFCHCEDFVEVRGNLVFQNRDPSQKQLKDDKKRVIPNLFRNLVFISPQSKSRL